MTAPWNWDDLDACKYRDEREAVSALLAACPLDDTARALVEAEAETLVRAARRSNRRQGVVESFLQEFSLGTKEGLALMCLAEALLRTPDQDTRDRLIAEKIGSADWASHLGRSDSLFVNASTWGLMLTGKLVEVDEEARRDVGGFIKRLAGRLGEPVVRQAVMAAVRIMGEQFVLGRTIEEALKRARRDNVLCSFDMLGEGARTAADAERYERLYADAIRTVGEAGHGAGPEHGHGVSVKLSALSPRYEATQEARVWTELYPRVKRLAVLASRYDLNFALDAEEADRLVLSLKLLERLAHEDELGHWTGLGLVVQAYQKRAVQVVGRVADLARASGRRIMVRLVKGAYWDTEIKRAQVAGRPGYPVYTTKPATDLSYLVAAKALIDASPALYPQFATHNAHTLAAVRHMAAEAGVRVEHQRLHGMGEALYGAAYTRFGNDMVLRAYAPVGGHEDLLPYLVRRLLENGANTSFVHALLDDSVPAKLVVGDPVAAAQAHPGPHAKIPLPRDMYGQSRCNSLGRDLSMRSDRERLAAATRALREERLQSGPLVGGKLQPGGGEQPVASPVDHRRVLGAVSEALASHIDQAFRLARRAHDRVRIERNDRRHVEHARRDAGRREQLGRGERARHHDARRDERDVAALAQLQRSAEFERRVRRRDRRHFDAPDAKVTRNLRRGGDSELPSHRARQSAGGHACGRAVRTRPSVATARGRRRHARRDGRHGVARARRGRAARGGRHLGARAQHGDDRSARYGRGRARGARDGTPGRCGRRAPR